MQYAKPAAVLRMYERYLSQLVNTDTALPLILRVRLGFACRFGFVCRCRAAAGPSRAPGPLGSWAPGPCTAR